MVVVERVLALGYRRKKKSTQTKKEQKESLLYAAKEDVGNQFLSLGKERKRRRTQNVHDQERLSHNTGQDRPRSCHSSRLCYDANCRIMKHWPVGLPNCNGCKSVVVLFWAGRVGEKGPSGMFREVKRLAVRLLVAFLRRGCLRFLSQVYPTCHLVGWPCPAEVELFRACSRRICAGRRISQRSICQDDHDRDWGRMVVYWSLVYSELIEQSGI